MDADNQVLIRESQPQAVPYAAASSDPALTEESVTGQVDQGVEQGLATAATTEIADIAYSHSSQPDASSQLIQQDTSAVLPGPTDVEQQDHPGLNVQEASQDNTSASQIAPNALKMQGLLSLDSQKRNNIHPLGTSKVLTSAGTNVIVLDLTTSLPEYIATPIQGGIGALTASADGRYFAVAEKRLRRAPMVYIYQYPSLKLVQTLERGTEQAYSAAAFNASGTRLATVGSYPDFMLTVWDWEAGHTLLRSKAFSQEVYNVSFNPYADGSLVTSGTGHIRFWSMARTFTGLKLQGSIGKFGNEELSDVSGYTQMPDGKVLCGAENGCLLMWSGALIKYVLKQSPNLPCHDGAVAVVLTEQNRKRVLTAGSDGVVKLWDLQQLMSAEPEEGSQVCYLQPLEELPLGAGVRVRGLVWQPDGSWLVSDESGNLLKVTLAGDGSVEGAHIQTLLTFHAGPIVGITTSPFCHTAVTAGADGTVRLFDYSQKKMLYKMGFDKPICSLLSLPSDLDSTSQTFLLGFADGVVRAVLQCSDAWKVTARFKPHSGSVTALSVSPDCSMLATASADKTIFLLKVVSTNTYDPLGFFKLDQEPACMEWHPSSSKLIIGCRDGDVVEVAVPRNNPSATDTFELQVSQQHYSLKLPQPPAAAMAAEAGAEDKPEEVQQPAIEAAEVKGPVSFIKYIQEDSNEAFLVSAGGAATGMTLKCMMADPQAVTAYPSYHAKMTAMRLSQESRYLVQGFGDGVVRAMQSASSSRDTLDLLQAPFWERQVHDCQTGSVTAMATSFDESYLLTAAQDGTLYVHEVTLPGINRLEGTTAELPTVAEDSTTAAGIASGDAYSLEEARKKKEQDKLQAAADAKKQGVKAYVADLRKEFAELVKLNAVAKLPQSDFEVDPGLREMIEAQIKEEEETVRQEMAWESEKKRVAVAKLRKYFLGDVEVEHIVLHAFRADKNVTSFITKHMPAELIEGLQKLRRKESQATPIATPSTGPSPAHSGALPALPSVTKMGASVPQAAQAAAAAAAEEHTVSKQELRRLARKRREAELLAFGATRPDDSFESPADLQAIREAEHNMGDFKLKSDPDYIPPEDQRSTVSSKKCQIMLLDEAVYTVKMDFNQRFLALREVKRRVCQQLGDLQGPLKETMSALGKDTAALTDPKLLPDEEPELRDKVTDEDLKQYAVANKQPLGKTKAKQQDPLPPQTKAAALPPHGPMSELELSEQAFKSRKLEYKREQLEQEIQDLQEAFDSALVVLRKEKLNLEAHVKAAQIKRLTYQQELQLLKDSEGREQALAGKMASKQAEQAELAARVGDCQAKLEGKVQDLRNLTEAKHQVVNRFDDLVEEGHPAHDALLKIFIKKIKRNKKKDAGLADESSDSSDEDDSDDDNDDDDNSQEEGEEVCPPNCEVQLYDKVCELREARLDEEDAAAEVGKAMEQLKKDRESLAKKERLMDQSLKLKEYRESLAKKERLMDLKAINDEALAFQREKQAKLNKVEVVVLLRMHQIEYLQDGQLPEDLSGALLFSSTQLAKLKRRVHELADERAELKAGQRQLRHEHLQLLKDKATSQAKLAELQQKAKDVQMLKFGQEIDLDMLDKVGSAKGVEEMRIQLKQQEAAHAKELAHWDANIRERNDELTRLTSENTQCLTSVANYTRSQMDMERTLANTQAHIFGDIAAQKRAEVAERDALVQLVNDQAQQLEMLRAQLIALRSKSTPMSA